MYEQPPCTVAQPVLGAPLHKRNLAFYKYTPYTPMEKTFERASLVIAVSDKRGA